MIIWVSVVLRRTAYCESDWHFDDLSLHSLILMMSSAEVETSVIVVTNRSFSGLHSPGWSCQGLMIDLLAGNPREGIFNAIFSSRRCLFLKSQSIAINFSFQDTSLTQTINSILALVRLITKFSNFNFILICRLPIPRPGEVLGLVGTNGIGKSTALKILAGKQKPNLGRFNVGFALWKHYLK